MPDDNKEETQSTDPEFTMPEMSVDPLATSDLVIETAPSFAIASLMIGSAQVQCRAMEASVANLNQTFLVGLSTTTRCVNQILDEPTHQQAVLNSLIAANKI